MRVSRTLLLWILSILIACIIILAFIQWRVWHPQPSIATAQPPAAPVWTPIHEEKLGHGRFEHLVVYPPKPTPRGVVILLSGGDGWTPHMADLGRRLAERGAMVVGIDAGEFAATLEKDGATCEFPDGDLENLSHFVQAYYHLPTYFRPILAGYADGATLAYASLAQAPANTFAAAVSLEFCPASSLQKPLCKASSLDFNPHTRGGGVDFLPAKQLTNPWIVAQSSTPPTCPVDVQRFVAQVPNSRWIPPPAASGGAAGEDWAAAAALIETLLAKSAPPTTTGTLQDLPIVFVPAAAGGGAADVFAIMLSGDGGWAGIDKEVAAQFAASGIPVVGLDSLRYFWTARTPEGLARDLDRIIGTYVTELHRQRVLLIGYSQGADVLPFAVNRLSNEAHAHVELAAIMGMSEHALFEFHVSSWVSDDDSGPATLPEVDRINGLKVLCIYGAEETDSLCPHLDPHKFSVVQLKGGHHFDGDYAGLARTILAAHHD